MRIRQVKPAFWTDKRIAALPKSARLTYIGLWMLADDAGWIESFDVEQAAAELLPFDSAKRRERDLAADVARLTEAGRVIAHVCGCLQVPTLPEHQRVGGRLVLTQRDAHAKNHARMDTEPTSHASSHGMVGNGSGMERNVTVGNGMGAPARRKENGGDERTLPPFEDMVARGKA